MNDNTSTVSFVCPICNKEFNDLTLYANHMTQHSEEEKKRKAEKEKRRKADQKKFDAAKLEKLKKMYEDAYSEYINAKTKFMQEYGAEDNDTIDLSGLFNFLNGWDRWR